MIPIWRIKSQIKRVQVMMVQQNKHIYECVMTNGHQAKGYVYNIIYIYTPWEWILLVINSHYHNDGNSHYQRIYPLICQYCPIIIPIKHD